MFVGRPHKLCAWFETRQFSHGKRVLLGRDWLLKSHRAGMEWLSRLLPAMIRLCTLLCLVVFVVGLVRNEIVFGCTHASKFWVSDTWAPAPCVYEAILAREGRWNWEDGDIRDGRGQMNRTKQTKHTRREPNMTTVHYLIPDATPDDSSRATNRPLNKCKWTRQRLTPTLCC